MSENRTQRERRPESAAPTKQARSEQTLQRILVAAEALVSEKGLADVSIPDIVARAGSSVGGFYARFKDKRALLHALEERFLERMEEKLEQLADPAKWSEAATADVVVACVHELVTTARDQQNLIRAFFSTSAQDPAFIEEGLRFRRRVSQRISALLLERRAELGHPEPEVAVDLGVQFAFGLMLQGVVFGGTWAAGRTLSDAALEREIARSFLSYLGIAPSPSSHEFFSAPKTRSQT